MNQASISVELARINLDKNSTIMKKWHRSCSKFDIESFGQAWPRNVFKESDRSFYQIGKTNGCQSSTATFWVTTL